MLNFRKVGSDKSGASVTCKNSHVLSIKIETLHIMHTAHHACFEAGAVIIITTVALCSATAKLSLSRLIDLWSDG